MINVTVPDGKEGDWSVETFTVSEQESMFTRMRAIQHPEGFVAPGSYKRLKRGGVVVMSNTQMEVSTNQPIIRNATGNVLINGLGLGMVLTAILERNDIRSVTIIENAPEVIKLVGSHFEKDRRVKVILCDAFEFKPPKSSKYDAVWHDIWDYMCEDHLSEMTRLKRKYVRKCEWQGCWSEGMYR